MVKKKEEDYKMVAVVMCILFLLTFFIAIYIASQREYYRDKAVEFDELILKANGSIININDRYFILDVEKPCFIEDIDGNIFEFGQHMIGGICGYDTVDHKQVFRKCYLCNPLIEPYKINTSLEHLNYFGD